MFGLSFWEIAMVLVVALVVLGPKRLPGLARTIGGGLRSLRRASADLRHAVEEPLREVQQPLEEMRQELYQTVHHFEGEVTRGMQDEDAGEGDGDGTDEASLAQGDEPLPSLAAAEPLEEHDDVAASEAGEGADADADGEAALEEDELGRVAATNPFQTDPYDDLYADEDDDVGDDAGAEDDAAGGDAEAAADEDADKRNA